MSKFYHSLFTSLFVLTLHADAPLTNEAMPEFPTAEFIQMPIEETPVVPQIIEPKVVAPAPKKVVDKTPEVDVKPFTGKIKARKVRMRLRPDLDSRIIKELSKNEYVSIVGEKGDFWAVQPPADTKAYIFRSFVLENTVEGNHVNVRLEPSLDAPVIGHLNSGERIDNPVIAAVNPKWFEIPPPSQTRFYIAKEYIEYVGGPDVKAKHDRRQATVEQSLDASAVLAKSELRKSFTEIDFERVVTGYKNVIDEYTEFPDLVEQAKEALASFQETYLQKRITHMEAEQIVAESKQAEHRELVESASQITDRMKIWEPIEEALYSSWSNINENRDQHNYYDEQKLASVELSGIVEPYNAPVKSKPGDFIIRDKDTPVAYIYSTKINLQNLVGKQVTVIASPRPNHNFAFPAYFVLDVE